MINSRLERVRSRKAGKQGVIYLVLAAILIVATILWGLPAIAKITGLLIKTDKNPLVVDEQRPTPPIFSDIPEATYSGQVRIAGFAQPGLDVILFINGAEYDRKLVSESGTFNFEKVVLTEGDNTSYAYTSTQKDLRSEQSKTYVIVLDSTKPTVTLDSPKEGEVFRGQGQRITSFSGNVSELGSKVFIGERMVIVSSDGKFTLPYQLVEGDQEIQIRAMDKAGNENQSSIKLRWEP
jgi:bacillopeptidase F